MENEDEIINPVIIKIINEKDGKEYEEKVSCEYFAMCCTLGKKFDEEKKQLKIKDPIIIRVGNKKIGIKRSEVYRHDVIKVMNNLKADKKGVPTFFYRKRYTFRPKDGELLGVKRIFSSISGSYVFNSGNAVHWLNELGFPTGWDKDAPSTGWSRKRY